MPIFDKVVLHFNDFRCLDGFLVRINGCEMSLRWSLQQFLFILHLPQRRQNCLRDNFLSGFFLGLVDERADAILLLNSSIFLSERTLVANLAAKNRLPAMYPQAE